MHDGLRQDYSSPGGRHRVHGVKNWVSGATRINASVASVQHHSQVQGRAGELRRASGGAMLSSAAGSRCYSSTAADVLARPPTNILCRLAHVEIDTHAGGSALERC